jgi:IclR family pca regulon transcriptional regulator
MAPPKKAMNGNNSRYFLKSLAKGMNVLYTLANSGEPLGLVELSRRSRTNNATVTRICHTLAELGYLSRDRQRRFYLTPKLLSLGYASMSSLSWHQVARYYLERLAEKTGETVNLSVLQGNELMYLVRINNTGRILPFDLQLGSRLPLHCTSMGKSLLAFLDRRQLDRILRDYDFASLTHRTISDETEFRRELALVKKRGYAVNDEELSVGLRSVSAPIVDSDGHAIAALNIAVPTRRVSRQVLEQRLAPEAVKTAGQIQRALGKMESGSHLSKKLSGRDIKAAQNTAKKRASHE